MATEGTNRPLGGLLIAGGVIIGTPGALILIATAIYTTLNESEVCSTFFGFPFFCNTIIEAAVGLGLLSGGIWLMERGLKFWTGRAHSILS